jgi:hypothetical protein
MSYRTIKDIDDIVTTFNANPTSMSYFIVFDWYTDTVSDLNNTDNLDHYDLEHLTCVYIFLLAANIKHKYQPLTLEEHQQTAKQLRDFIERATPFQRPRRKTYMDCGIKTL